MKTLLTLVFATIVSTAALADGSDDAESALALWQGDPGSPLEAADVDLKDFLWLARPVVIFADSPADPRVVQQLALFAARAEDLVDRDVVIIIDADPDAATSLRTELRPRGFMLALLGKDGGVKLRKPTPWNVRELTRVIDKTPERQQEIRDRRDGG